MYTHKTRIALHHTDAAGVIFTPRILELAHQAYEALMLEIGFPLQNFVYSSGPALPIVHAEADFVAPLKAGDEIEIKVRIQSVTVKSFRLDYRFLNSSGDLMATAGTVHTAVSADEQVSVPLPEDLRVALQSDLQSDLRSKND